MTFLKITAQPLASVALTTGLIVSSALHPVLATEITNVGIDLAPPTEQKSLVGKTLSITVGALSGVALYSFITGDWAWTLLSMETAASAATAAPAISAGTAAGTALPGVAAVPTAAGTTAVVATEAVSSLAWASRWALVAASGLTGAFLGNAIYSSR